MVPALNGRQNCISLTVLTYHQSGKLRPLRGRVQKQTGRRRRLTITGIPGFYWASSNNGQVQDRDLYGQMLGVREPWRVESVDLKLTEGEVHVHLTHDPGLEWLCSECGKNCPLFDRQPERRWRHLDTFQYRTILHTAPPRSNCPEHGVRNVKLPWAEPSSRFTAILERLAIDWMKAASQKAVADQLHLSWDEVHAIQERAVVRGLARREVGTISRLGVDEKSFTKGHRYFTLVNRYLRRLLCQIAWAAIHTRDTFFAGLFGRLKPRIEGKGAAWAVAHRIGNVIWLVLHEETEYREMGSAPPNERTLRRKLKRLLKNFGNLGVDVRALLDQQLANPA